jgi:hypothetical protein
MIRKHTHKLKRKSYRNKEQIYFCVLDCDYKINVTLAEGKEVICWRCGKPFNITTYSCRLAKPHCSACHKFEVTTPELHVDIADDSILKTNEPLADDLINKLFPTEEIITKRIPIDTETDNLKKRLMASIGKSITSSKDSTEDDML